MKLAKKLLGIAAIFAVIGFMALPLTGCPTDVEKPAVVPEDTRPTPTAEDFDIGNLTQGKGNITAVTITPKTGKSDGVITIYYNNDKILPTEIGTYPVTFDVAETDDWKAASGLSAGTLSIVERIFTDITDLGTWLSQQEANDKDTPYSIALDVSDISTLRTTLNNNPNKYVSIVFTDKITTIPNRLFIGDASPYGCATLTGITIPDSVTSIGSHAFYACTSLASITIPDSVTSIGEYAFSGTPWLNAQPDGLIYFGKIAYSYKGSMPENTSIQLREGTRIINDAAFAGSTNLISVTIPNSVTSIGQSAFHGCTGLTSVTIGSGVTSIGVAAFENCTSLTSIIIPDSVTSIGQQAFANCTGLTSVTIGSGVTSIGSLVFESCTSLTSIIIPDSVTSIGQQAFQNCTGLTSIIIPDSVTSIENYAFIECTGLTEITIGSGVTSIGYMAFDECDNLKNITIKTDKVVINSLSNWGTIFTAENLVVTFEGVASIPVSAFYNCTNLTNVTIGNSVTDIRYGAFPGCTSLTAFNVDAGNSVYSSQDGVLYNKDKTTLIQYPAGKTDASFTIPNSVTSIDGSAFSLCASLTAFNVDAGNSVYSSQDGVLYNKDKTTLIQYPAGKTDVSFTIPNSVTDIGSGAFQYCTNLASVTIPNGVTSIGNGAFARCSGLTSVTFNGTIASDKFLGGNSFFSTFDGDLRAKFYETDSTNGTPGTYTTTAPVSRDSEWSKQ